MTMYVMSYIHEQEVQYTKLEILYQHIFYVAEGSQFQSIRFFQYQINNVFQLLSCGFFLVVSHVLSKYIKLPPRDPLYKRRAPWI